ncbi:Harbinger transposase-derived nuclease [Quillaja saponaria]|uniref:Harbinger transposase-derived nuclease n=1 Tax=Quillaja saponaria TaxID=32244 RepID=A0AAD7QD44_QUISA|nr:Harbinger transposase-derived nuclease [Quillaja saponaria]
MEISSVPLLNQEDFSQFYSLFQEMDDFNVNNNNSKKRRRKEEEGESGDGNGSKDELKKSKYNDILTSLILFDEAEKHDEGKRVMESQQDWTLFDANYKQQAQAMNEYYTQIQDQYSELDEFDQNKTKRARRSAVAVAASASGSMGSANSVQTGDGSGPVGQHRRLWVKDRSKAWWDSCNHPDFPEDEFRRAFRMSKATFNMVCEELDSAVIKKNTMLRDAIPVRQRVAVCIWRLATGEPLRLVSKRFGLGISTCHKLVLEVCSAIKTVLMPKFVHWPEEQRMKVINEEFKSMSGIPNVGGSMYTTHIPIIAPKVNVAAYYNKRHTERNQKTSYSITVQGVVDPKGVFTDVFIGWPGSVPDDQVLEKSALYQRAIRGLLKDSWIVGNSGYPLMDGILVPYTHQNFTWTQHAFNEKIGDVQSVAKEAFARLKGRWSCLQKRTEVKLQDLPGVLGACCVLHNICEMNNEEMDPELKFELFDDEMVAENSLRSANAVQARDHIAHNLLHHGLAGTSFL